MRPVLRVEGAAENNLREVDVCFPGGVTAIVGVSGSGKSSLAFDTLYAEARRRLVETLSLGAAVHRTRPARVRAIFGLRPAVAVAQNVLNVNPLSTVATAVGVHPFLRVLYARFADRRCPRCAEPVTVASLDTQVAVVRELLSGSGAGVDVFAPLVRGAYGTHRRLLGYLAERFDATAVEVDGRRLPASGVLDPDRPHEIAVRVGTAEPGSDARAVRALLESVTALGSAQVTLRAGDRVRTLARAPLCPRCATRLPVARPVDFARDGDAPAAYRLAGRTLPDLLRLPVAAARTALDEAGLPPRAGRARSDVDGRLAALAALGLGYLPLDRPMPTLSRGEAQRVRLAVILANDIEELLHVVDEPSIGLDPAQVAALGRQLARLRGPVVLVEHDRYAVAAADHVVELGPGAAAAGGRVVFTGAPAALWRARTESGRWFSGRSRPQPPAHRSPARQWIVVRAARRHNLTGFDCRFPVGRLTAVTGPSGAGKTTLVRDVLVASLRAGTPCGCANLSGPPLHPVVVNQDPIGVNPRSNPATYTGLADRIRRAFAAGTTETGSAFSFNRPEGACPDCAGMGAVEVKLPYLPSEWLTCESCAGTRFGPHVRSARARLADGATYTIAEVFAASVEQAAALFADDARATAILRALREVGLDYLPLGQPSPTLSGGEAQRVKLAKQLAGVRTPQLVFLDEPTTGLHPANLAQLVRVLGRLVERDCTVVVVEHNADVVAAADWVLRLGPGGGPDGGRLLHAGPADVVAAEPPVPRRAPRPARRGRPELRIRGATANNLRNVSVTLPKDAITAVVGVSGSGKSSLVRDVLAAEATRRLLESLSVYERQSVTEGPQAPVRSITGLGPTVVIGAERGVWSPRSTVGTATELSHHLGIVLAYAGTRECPRCGGTQRWLGPAADSAWRCTGCDAPGTPARPADFSPATYEAACLRCHGIGTIPLPRVDRLIRRPDRPLCTGALYSPGYFPGSYLSKPDSGGYWMLQALGERYAFDPFGTPWQEMSEEAREAFLFGEVPLRLSAAARRFAGQSTTWRGVFRILANWDVGGRYTDRAGCPDCGGGRLRPHLLQVRLAPANRPAAARPAANRQAANLAAANLAAANRQVLHAEPIGAVRDLLGPVRLPAGVPAWTGRSLSVVRTRIDFLERVGLGYLHLDRLIPTLSAGEVQRVRLAALLGAELTGMTVLLDEPSRGLHPREVDVLAAALTQLRAAGNTVVLVDHDSRLIERAGQIVVLGPGAGRDGGRVVAAGAPAAVRAVPAARSLLEYRFVRGGARRRPASWLVVRGPTENNLCGADVALPLGVLAGVCGVSGSGKSTLVIDILARALAPRRLTTSVAQETIAPGAHAGLDGAPPRTVYADQSRAGIASPAGFLGVLPALRRAYADSAQAVALGLDADALQPRCDACRGRGSVREDMGFLPAAEHPCDTCEATGYRPAARELVVRGLSLPQLHGRTLDEVLQRWADHEPVARPVRAAARLGLGYLTVGQPARSLSGGERQRLKLAAELARPASRPTLYLLDEPTVGLHPIDVARLVDALTGLVTAGHSVLVVEHDPALLASCDYLVELGPVGGPAGGRVVAAGTPEQLASGGTATAPYLRSALSPPGAPQPEPPPASSQPAPSPASSQPAPPLRPAPSRPAPP